jgi:hypothetical protein
MMLQETQTQPLRRDEVEFEQTTRNAADAAKRAVVSDTPPRINEEE